MHQEHWGQVLAKALEIAQVLGAVLFRLASPLCRTWQGGEDDSRAGRMRLHQFIEDEVLGAAGKIVEREGDGGRKWEARC